MRFIEYVRLPTWAIAFAILFACAGKLSATEVCGLSPYTLGCSALLKASEAKATVGVIPYYVHNKQVYILLGRERVDSKKTGAAGTFSDFGGSVKLDGTTILQNAVRELAEETMDEIRVKESQLLNKARLLYTKTKEGRQVFYLFYPMSGKDYILTRDFNILRAKASAYKINPAYLEKDQFVWFKLDDIVSNIPDNANENTKVSATDIDGNTHDIMLRGYFVKDCLLHPELANLAAKLPIG